MRIQGEEVLGVDDQKLVAQAEDVVEALHVDGVVKVDDEDGEGRDEDAGVEVN